MFQPDFTKIVKESAVKFVQALPKYADDDIINNQRLSAEKDSMIFTLQAVEDILADTLCTYHRELMEYLDVAQRKPE